MEECWLTNSGGASRRRFLMRNYTHQTAPTQFVEAAGIRFAYRRFANRRSGAKIDIPLLFFMHFTGTMDHWDPALTDGFAQDREVILFNNAGVSSSSGEVPTSIEEMAQHAAAFIDALGVKKLDALGFSIGGLIAQQFTTDRPDLVRKLILVGTGPRRTAILCRMKRSLRHRWLHYKNGALRRKIPMLT